MKKSLLVVPFLLLSFIGFGQVGIGTSQPNASAQLEIVASDRGVLITQVSLKSTTDQTTITNGNVESLLVYNTATISDVAPGYYYWYNNKWQRIATGDGGQIGTNTTNISFTTNGVDLILNDSDGNFVSIALSDLFSETVTNLVDNGNGTITYTNETGTAQTIDIASIVENNQTLTSFQQNIPTGEITYTDEDSQSHTAQVVSSDPQNMLSVGSDGGAALTPSAFQNSNAVKIVSTDYSASSSDQIIISSGTTQDITITLPNPATLEGKKYTIRKQDSGESYYVQVDGNIAGIPVNNTLYTAVPYTGWTLVSDGIQWYIINKF